MDKSSLASEAYSKRSQTSTMELLAKVIKEWKAESC